MTVDFNKRQSEVIEALRFPLMVLVVFIHVLPMTYVPIEMNLSGMNLFHLVSEMISHNIGGVAVPCFFLFSGYFFFCKLKQWSFTFYGSQLKKRIKTLMLPYLLWNVLMIVAIVLKQTIFSWLSLEAKEDGIFNIHVQSLLDLFWIGPVDFPLWYLRDLICMSLLTPLFYYLFRSLKHYALILLILLYWTQCETKVPGLSTTAFLFFGAGAYSGINQKNMLLFCSKNRKICGVSAFLLLCCATFYNGSEYHEYLVRLFIPFGVVTAINIGHWFISKESWKKKLCSLSSTVFFIYAVHEIYIINWVKGYFSRTSLADSGGGLLLSYVLIPSITLVVCLALYYLLSKTVPRLLAFATGGRVPLFVKGKVQPSMKGVRS